MSMIYILFFFSGLTALVYEVTWARRLSLIFGTDSYSIATILAVFFAGLALGSYLCSRILANRKLIGANKRMANPLFLYALLELGIGIYALSSPLLFELIKILQAGFWKVFTPSFGSFNLFTFILSLIALIIPTTLMGATLPTIVSAAGNKRAGWLYGINTLGAVTGVILSGFFLIAYIGVNETIWLAAGINLLIGITAVYFSRITANYKRMEANPTPSRPAGLRGASERIDSRLILVVYALSGFAAIGLEVLWTRALTMVIGGSVYAFSLVLAAFLIGIALGSLLGSKLFSKTQKPLIWFAVLEIILGLTVILSIYLLGNLPLAFLAILKKFGTSFSNLQFGIFLLAGMPIIIPTIIMGIIFPVVVQLGSVGKLYASNTVGGVFGALITGFLLIPIIGTSNSIVIIAAIYLIIGITIIFISRVKKLIKSVFATMFLISIFIGLIFAKWEKSFFAAGFYVDPQVYQGMTKDQLFKKLKKTKILFEADGVSAYVSVKKEEDESISLQINGKSDASTGSDMENQVLLGQIPMLLAPNPKKALVIGLGSGITLGSILSHPVESVDVVEIEQKVVEAAKFFEQYNNNAPNDRRVKLIIADGRNYLLASGKKYDVISSEPSNPWLTGSAKLFTKEFFELMKKSINEDGVVIHWINMYAVDNESLKRVIKAFAEVFPEARGFGVVASNDFLLVGSNKEIKLDPTKLSDAFKKERIKKDLERIGIDDETEIMSRIYLDKKSLKKMTAGVPPNLDNHPYIEFAAPKRLYQATSENPWRMILANLSSINKKADEMRMARLLTRIYLVEKKYPEVIKEGEKALAFDNKNQFLLATLARAYFEEGSLLLNDENYGKAVVYFEKSVKLKETPEAYINLGISLESQGNLNAAIEAYKNSLELDPENKTAKDRVGELYKLRK